MTSAARSPIDLLGLWHPCGYCGARPGRWCRVARGRTVGRLSPWLHADRSYPIQQAQHIGYSDGSLDAFGEIMAALETAGERWSQLPENPTVADVWRYVEKRREQRRAWLESAENGVRSALIDYQHEPDE